MCNDVIVDYSWFPTPHSAAWNCQPSTRYPFNIWHNIPRQANYGHISQVCTECLASKVMFGFRSKFTEILQQNLKFFEFRTFKFQMRKGNEEIYRSMSAGASTSSPTTEDAVVANNTTPSSGTPG
ncbi:hypothetical protein TNIN_171021 [Trichonephila inaurata madagascariensis]|uniref:Uncharacterized protein n=1 Tax=Trichonephila inaurata madagascariensis TaxID=2747483 RepID=A0A8X6XV61_9ARAC|nr:hypothetical protein TNIN_171021 [Trichonephila inaurata madagascariensis]